MTKLTSICIKILFCSLFSFFLSLSYANSQSQLYDQEHAVLLKIRQYLQTPPFLSHWILSKSSHCSWPEINCTDGSVTKLAMIHTDITQTIPPFICDLTNLTYIDFQWNDIPGEFPTALYNCSKLEHLDLSQNYFVGKIPDDIDRLANLQFLSLGGNNFSGDIPKSIGNLKELKSLQLHQNLFNGSIPAEIGNLSNLESLYMFSNIQLLLPSSFTQLKNLKDFEMYRTNLIGELPDSIGDMVALEYLDLSQTGLRGEIPSGLFTLKNLSVVYLWRNRLSGEIPEVVEALNLTILDLAENKLTGKIPDDFEKLKKLTGLSLSMNQLSGEVPESLGRLPALTSFRVSYNNLSGTLPPDFGRYSELEFFRVSSNVFTGRLPENLCYFGKLLRLDASDNKLNGELPLGNCSSLYFLEINNNKFSGNIPSSLWTSVNLSTFMVSYNQFSGRIPAGVSSSKNMIVFNASNNLFSGSIPQQLTTLPQLTTLLLDQNQLTGPLPSDIISWNSLIKLNLSHNQLSGQIPDAIGQLPILSQLDLSENGFSGQIPPQLGRLRSANLNLSSNFLTGRIPSEFENLFYASSFLNNSGLCTDTSVLNLTLCNSGSQRPSRFSSVSRALIISLGVVAPTLVAFLSLLLMLRVYRKRKQILDTSWKLTPFQELSFTETNIVSSMTDQNIIGSGGYGMVYRVAVDGIGFVAVKKIRNNRKLEKRLEIAFLAEVQILSTIRHNNIVKLLCCISNEDSLLLVCEYLENRSLDQWLHKKRRPSSTVLGSVYHVLDWPKRLQIAIGAARGLSYMHHDCSPPIVHRDVKTSNILLDSDFNAKVADFGLARMLIRPGEFATVSVVAGSFGYIAPEYAQTRRVNEKIDVFSFGVILLELTTGKEATSGDEHSSLAEWVWHHIHLEGNIEEVLDVEIMETCYLDEMCTVFKLGVMCTAVQPARRPTMKEVLRRLLRCRDPSAYGERIVGLYDAVPFLRNTERETRLAIDDDNFPDMHPR